MILHSFCTPELLAHIIYEKYCKAVPLTRLEKEFKANGVNLSSTTMANWIIMASQRWLKPGYVVDGTPYNRATEDHTWNRVYYDGCWWDLDVTNDITSTANGKSLYGFRELTSAHTSDKDYYITKIY
jgi:hypothetical protein